MTGPKNPSVQGGQIHITIVTPDTVEQAAKVVRVHEIHNETLCSVNTYLDGSPVDGRAASGGDSQHPYDTSPHAQEHQNEARSSATGGTIVIEIHNETRVIENRYFSSMKAAADNVPEAASKRKSASSVEVKKGVSQKKVPAKRRLAIAASKPASSSVARAARQARRGAPSPAAAAASAPAAVVGPPSSPGRL